MLSWSIGCEKTPADKLSGRESAFAAEEIGKGERPQKLQAQLKPGAAVKLQGTPGIAQGLDPQWKVLKRVSGTSSGQSPYTIAPFTLDQHAWPAPNPQLFLCPSNTLRNEWLERPNRRVKSHASKSVLDGTAWLVPQSHLVRALASLFWATSDAILESSITSEIV